jgi:hypothetical protein
MIPLYFATPFRHAANPHLVGFNTIDQKTRIFAPIRGAVAELPVDVARNALVEDFLAKTQGVDDAWLLFMDDDVLFPTDALDLWLEALRANPTSPVFFGEYPLKKRTFEPACVFDAAGGIVTVATGCMFVHRSVFVHLRTDRATAFGLQPYDGRWFICSAENPLGGEDAYFTKTLLDVGIVPVKIPGLECVHVEFSRKAAFGHPDVVKDGKIRKEKAYIYAIEPDAPLYEHIVEQ